MRQRRKSASDGVSAKSVALRLTPEEREEIETIESTQHVAKAEFARQAYRAGKQIALSNIQNQGASS